MSLEEPHFPDFRGVEYFVLLTTIALPILAIIILFLFIEIEKEKNNTIKGFLAEKDKTEGFELPSI